MEITNLDLDLINTNTLNEITQLSGIILQFSAKDLNKDQISFLIHSESNILCSGNLRFKRVDNGSLHEITSFDNIALKLIPGDESGEIKGTVALDAMLPNYDPQAETVEADLQFTYLYPELLGFSYETRSIEINNLSDVAIGPKPDDPGFLFKSVLDNVLLNIKLEPVAIGPKPDDPGKNWIIQRTNNQVDIEEYSICHIDEYNCSVPHHNININFPIRKTHARIICKKPDNNQNIYNFSENISGCSFSYSKVVGNILENEQITTTCEIYFDCFDRSNEILLKTIKFIFDMGCAESINANISFDEEINEILEK